MGARIVDEPIKELWGEQLTVTGNAGVRTSYNIRHGFNELLINPNAALRLHLVPSIEEVLFFDASRAANAQWVDLTKQFFNANMGRSAPALIHGGRGTDNAHPVAGGTLDVLNSMTADDALYIAVDDLVGGFYFDVGNANGNVATLAGAYSVPGSFVTITITDGTTNGFGADGPITFTTPANGEWKSQAFDKLGIVVQGLPPRVAFQPHLWFRITTDTTFDATTSLLQVSALHRLALGGALTTSGGGSFKNAVEYELDVPESYHAFEVLAVAAGATTIDVMNRRR